MTNNVKLTDWAEYFDAVPSSTLVNKGCMKNLFKTFNSSISSDKALSQVEKHTETVFLARLSLRSGLNVFSLLHPSWRNGLFEWKKFRFHFSFKQNHFSYNYTRCRYSLLNSRCTSMQSSKIRGYFKLCVYRRHRKFER